MTNKAQEIGKMIGVSGQGVFGVARVIGRNDDHNAGRVRIYPLTETRTYQYLEDKNVEFYPFAEVLSPTKGENHGSYSTPEFGDFVIYTILASGYYILGCINNPTHEYAGMNIPVEAQNTQENGSEYNPSSHPDLTSKGYHLASPEIGDVYQPAAQLQRWRGNDTLFYNVTKIGTQSASAAKLMEYRSSDNNTLQLVDIGNNNTRPGVDGKNKKGYSSARQTDYRDLWEGFDINKEFWTERTDKAPLTNESVYVKLATNGHAGKDFSDAKQGDTGQEYPDRVRGEVRMDDREADGSHEAPKSYCPVYQTVKSEMGPDRYYQDKPSGSEWSGSVPFRFKVKKWIEDTGDAYDPETQHLNVGHYLTLSNTIFKRRAMLSTAKGHKLVMSDIDNDEKVLLNSHRGKHLYMEDGFPDAYNVMWLASEKHHMIFCDWMQPKYLEDDKGALRDKLVDPNQPSGAGCSYQLIQTELYQKIWMSDSSHCPRIHMHSTDGHEVLLLDHDKGVAGISSTPGKGKVQITTSDKQMQISMDVKSGELIIQNHNLGGDGDSGCVKIFAAGNMTLECQKHMKIIADLGMRVSSVAGMWSHDIYVTSFNGGGTTGASPTSIQPTVLTNIEASGSRLVNKFDPS